VIAAAAWTVGILAVSFIVAVVAGKCIAAMKGRP
jgi:hypothetical protein